MSIPRIHETCSLPEGTRLYFVGDSAEHINRIGSTAGQYSNLAGEPVSIDVSPERIIAHRSFTLEDVNRDSWDTVVGGARVVVAKAVQNECLDIHLVSAYVREEYRRKGLGNFVVGRLLSTTLTDFYATSLFVHGFQTLDPDIQAVLQAKGFSLTNDVNIASLKLPGRQIWVQNTEEDVAAVEQEIQAKKWSGSYGSRVYREGKLVGAVKRIEPDGDDWSSHKIGIFNADGTLMCELDSDDSDVDWGLTARIMLVNHKKFSQEV